MTLPCHCFHPAASVRPLPKVPWPSLDSVPVPERAPLLLADVLSYFNFWSVPTFAPLMSNDTLLLLDRARVRTCHASLLERSDPGHWNLEQDESISVAVSLRQRGHKTAQVCSVAWTTLGSRLASLQSLGRPWHPVKGYIVPPDTRQCCFAARATQAGRGPSRQQGHSLSHRQDPRAGSQ